MWTVADVEAALRAAGQTIREERVTDQRVVCFVATCDRHHPHPSVDADRPAPTAHLRSLR